MADGAGQGRGDAISGAGGAALLQGLLRLAAMLERPFDEAALRAALPVEEDLLELRHLERTVERLGFASQVLKATRSRLRRLPTPFLLVGREAGRVWVVRARTGSHVVLVEALHGGTTAATPTRAAAGAVRILLLRPAAAAHVPADQVPEPPAAAAKTPTAGPWRQQLMRRLRPVLGQVALASVVINLLALASPLFTMTVYNKVINHAALRTLDVLAIGMVSLFVFELVLRTLRGHLTAHTGARLDAALGVDTLHHLLRLPYRTFESVPAAQLLERLRQLEQVRTFLSSHLPLLMVDLAFVGLFLAAILCLAPSLALLTLGAMPLFALLSILAQRHQGALLQAQFKATAGKNAHLSETVGAALTVKALALEADMEARFDGRLVESAWFGFRASHVGHLIGSLGQALQQVTALGIVYVGARLIVAGEMSIGALVAVSILSARALAPMRQIAQALAQLQQTREAFTRLDALMREAPEGGPDQGVELPWTGRLRLERVTFHYAPGRPPALCEVSLDLAPGTALGVVGAPGSGKSTLVKLLLGLERPDTGRVFLDDHDLARLPPAAYRGRIGVVPQEVQLFSGTIAENIAMGARDRSFARIHAAAKFVGADEFIRRLPEGFDTRLGEGGSGLSLGQRQLVAIARALVRNPRILILDEATSALDAAAEAYLLANLRRAASGRTLVMVTHRPSVLAVCDRAVLLRQGRIVLTDTPQEVLRRTQAQGQAQGLAGAAAAAGRGSGAERQA